jgi:hypothetical protein
VAALSESKFAGAYRNSLHDLGDFKPRKALGRKRVAGSGPKCTRKRICKPNLEEPNSATASEGLHHNTRLLESADEEDTAAGAARAFGLGPMTCAEGSMSAEGTSIADELFPMEHCCAVR